MDYLKEARLKAKYYGLNPMQLFYANDGKHKLKYIDNNKSIYFGDINYNDYIIYKMLERVGYIKKGSAIVKRNSYLSRATKIKGNWLSNPLSKNNLAINILW